MSPFTTADLYQQRPPYMDDEESGPLLLFLVTGPVT